VMMTSAELLPAAVLNRKAVVYIRQSTQAQVQTNLESQRRQYDLVDVARQRGFHNIEVIDDDLGRSASGMVARSGFERLVGFSMGVSAKLAALHTVERGLIAQASCAHAALPSKRCSARERARLGQRLHRERCHPSFNH
jgi:hypothetical protein